ncbi:malto-oligosyltrehalose trehalohydrolase [Calidithermus chliarophilus]|uniref:malto-oligosyltrehalose trehalohydrolase n=1 Tax=Calidithermus chliarophilus TaxID=52023 RepID=UPI000425C443|nr:malto-oligosyltrehalose trehalohydrolase [Calidithermus chliarophilus]
MKRAGAWLEGAGTRFRVWAAGHERLEVVLYGEGEESYHLMEPEGEGYFTAWLEGVVPGQRYKYRVDGEGPFPDPASRFQPEGVHGPSEVVQAAFPWTDGAWEGLGLEELVVMEVHVGTATPEGTFAALAEKLPHYRELGVTALELMPLADFPGRWNWGYDGVSLYAPSRAYGRPEDLKRLVDAAHAHGLAVLLDVVYNHLGPDGNYLWSYSRDHFTARHKTPWGDGPNFELGPVRAFFVENALYWLEEFHLDGLRFDATHAILDDSPRHVLREIAERARERIPRKLLFVAEDERNEARLVLPAEEGGLGLDAVWADDFHHSLRRALAGDSEGYYAEYDGTAAEIARALEQGWVYCGQPTRRKGHPRGSDPARVPLPAFVHCVQNHDQVGNRAHGERLNHHLSPGAFRAASALLLLEAATPLLFMGQEWAARSPFLYFTDHHAELGRRVSEGRRAEFAGFSSFAAGGPIPDPQDPDTFLRSKLNWDELEAGEHRATLEFYRALLRLRRTHPALRSGQRAWPADGETLLLRRETPPQVLLLVAHWGEGARVELPAGPWRVLLASDGEPALRDGVLHVPAAGAVVLEAAGRGAH